MLICTFHDRGLTILERVAIYESIKELKVNLPDSCHITNHAGTAWSNLPTHNSGQWYIDQLNPHDLSTINARPLLELLAASPRHSDITLFITAVRLLWKGSEIASITDLRRGISVLSTASYRRKIALPRDQQACLKKSFKHELGHLLGLSHCRPMEDPCAMHDAPTLSGWLRLARKESGATYCPRCRALLNSRRIAIA